MHSDTCFAELSFLDSPEGPIPRWSGAEDWLRSAVSPYEPFLLIHSGGRTSQAKAESLFGVPTTSSAFIVFRDELNYVLVSVGTQLSALER